MGLKPQAVNGVYAFAGGRRREYEDESGFVAAVVAVKVPQGAVKQATQPDHEVALVLFRQWVLRVVELESGRRDWGSLALTALDFAIEVSVEVIARGGERKGIAAAQGGELGDLILTKVNKDGCQACCQDQHGYKLMAGHSLLRRQAKPQGGGDEERRPGDGDRERPAGEQRQRHQERHGRQGRPVAGENGQGHNQQKQGSGPKTPTQWQGD